MIGVVGGVGPYAGIDLVEKIFDQTLAGSDQEHLDVSLISMPAIIPDRTAFLLGKSAQNPGHGILEVVLKLQAVGASVVGIPCNSAHAPAIFGEVLARLHEIASTVKLLNMIEEVLVFLGRFHRKVRRVGVLGTTGTLESGIYSNPLGKAGFEVVLPDAATQQLVHSAIYDSEYGVKAKSNPPTARATQDFLRAIAFLRQKGARLVILGCTEIPLAVRENSISGVPLVDPAVVLARALIQAVRPDKLKPM